MTRRAYHSRKTRDRKKERADYPFYPNHILRGLIVVVAAFALIVFLAALVPPSLDRAADPLTGPDPGIQALWVLKPAIVLEKLFRSRVITSLTITALCLGFLLLPVLDRTGRQQVSKRLMVAIPFAILIVWLVLSSLFSMGAPG